jgi:hypothetical protein
LTWRYPIRHGWHLLEISRSNEFDRYVYAIVPKGNIEDVIEQQAYKKAAEIGNHLVEKGSWLP